MGKKLYSDWVTTLRQVRDAPRHSSKYGSSRVKAIRERTSLSQREFALLIGVSLKTLQNWEQARREPRGPAAALLRIVDRAPEAALQALHK